MAKPPLSVMCRNLVRRCIPGTLPPPVWYVPVKNPIQTCHELATEQRWDEIRNLHLLRNMPLTWFVVSHALDHSPNHPYFLPWAIGQGAPVIDEILPSIRKKYHYYPELLVMADRQVCKRPLTEKDKTPSSSGDLDNDPIY